MIDQISLFPFEMEAKEKSKLLFMPDGYCDETDYESEDIPAIVYLAFMSSPPRNLFVMNKREAKAFCSRKETAGAGKRFGASIAWMCCWTHYVDGWDKPENKARFQKDDGRFDNLLAELGIVPIYANR